MKKSGLFLLSPRTTSVHTRLGRAVFIIVGLSLSSALAEQRDRKIDDEADRKADRRIEAEVNLPIYQSPLKSIHPNSVGKHSGGSRLLPQRQSYTELVRSVGERASSKTDQDQQTKFAKSTRPGASNSSVLSKLDSLTQTQDKARQHVLYSLKAENIPTVPYPVLSQVQKSSTEKPMVVSPSQTPVNLTPILPNNVANWTRNDSVPHRGPGTASLGGPANLKNTGINGTEMKNRR